MTRQELADRIGVTPRAIKWYIHKGVLPPPFGRTRAARYGIIHVKAFNAYREAVPHPGDRVTAACFAEQRRDGLIPL